MNEEAVRALNEVIRQFGRQLVDRPERLRAALADILLSDAGGGPGIDALVAVSETGVASGMGYLTPDEPVTEAQVSEWFEQLAAAGLSRPDAASATAVWAQVLGSAERAREVSEISRTLTVPTEPDIDAEYAGPARTETVDRGHIEVDRTVVGSAEPGDVTVIGTNTLDASRIETEVVAAGSAPDHERVSAAVKPPRWAWIAAAAALVTVLAVGGLIASGLSTQGPDQRPDGGSGTSKPDPSDPGPANEPQAQLAALVLADDAMDAATPTVPGGVWSVATDNQGPTQSTVTVDYLNTWVRVAPAQCEKIALLVPTPPPGGPSPWSLVKVFHENTADSAWQASVLSSAMLFENSVAAEQALLRMAPSVECNDTDPASMTLTWRDPSTVHDVWFYDSSDEASTWTQVYENEESGLVLARRCLTDDEDPILMCWSFVHVSGAESNSVQQMSDEWFEQFVIG